MKTGQSKIKTANMNNYKVKRKREGNKNIEKDEEKRKKNHKNT